MLKEVKHTALAVAAGGILASCASDVPMPDVLSNEEMMFDLIGVTRTTVTSGKNIIDSPFAIFGNMKCSDEAIASAKFLVFDGIPVKYNKLKNTWTYNDTQYWLPGFEHSFVAVHPYSAIDPTKCTYNNNLGQLFSTIPFPITLPTQKTSSWPLTGECTTHRHLRHYP